MSLARALPLTVSNICSFIDDGWFPDADLEHLAEVLRDTLAAVRAEQERRCVEAGASLHAQNSQQEADAA